MCATCGCSDDAGIRVIDPSSPGHGHGHEHGHGHGHPEPGPDRTVLLEQDILAANDRLAADNRSWLASRGIHAVNVMSSPGSGKTTLLARTIVDRGGELPMSVIEGDQETVFDAERIKATGCRVIQVNTGAGCHLDAGMLAKALHTLAPPGRSTVFVENVGNLVCPALFDLGEADRVVVMSVTEGADKPLKYPHMFRTADVVLLNKIDLLPYVDFDVDVFTEDLLRVNPRTGVLHLSATTGAGLDAWYAWLADRVGTREI
ncbi:hydrogenase nickel incorporation protein HypB [Amycolatopsis pittospori]|uniref:hydrogenase nickel incorporation protein HypB n=1 Tax=Amycolatopsis pittospori TaxID=2749434 RepID=UPI0015F0EFFA|nr:hydrogenase nickel incorporation protein HypB [Amycolatopsis pittospori]